MVLNVPLVQVNEFMKSEKVSGNAMGCRKVFQDIITIHGSTMMVSALLGHQRSLHYG